MMDKPYHPEVVLGTDNIKVNDFNQAVIESIDLTYWYRTKREIKRVDLPHPQPGIPPVSGYQEKLLEEGWIEDNNI